MVNIKMVFNVISVIFFQIGVCNQNNPARMQQVIQQQGCNGLCNSEDITGHTASPIGWSVAQFADVDSLHDDAIIFSS